SRWWSMAAFMCWCGSGRRSGTRGACNGRDTPRSCRRVPPKAISCVAVCQACRVVDVGCVRALPDVLDDFDLVQGCRRMDRLAAALAATASHPAQLQADLRLRGIGGGAEPIGHGSRLQHLEGPRGFAADLYAELAGRPLSRHVPGILHLPLW